MANVNPKRDPIFTEHDAVSVIVYGSIGAFSFGIFILVRRGYIWLTTAKWESSGLIDYVGAFKNGFAGFNLIANWVLAIDIAIWFGLIIPISLIGMGLQLIDWFAPNRGSGQHSPDRSAPLEHEETAVKPNLENASQRAVAESFGVWIKTITAGWLWPRARRVDIGVLGRFGRVLHWTGASLAALCSLLSLLLLFETDLKISLLFLALALAFALIGRAALYILADE